MDSVVQDFRYAIRQLLKSRGFAAIAILTLAVGIGANTAIFSVVNGILLRPLPYPESDQLVGATSSIQHGEYLVLRERSRFLRESALYGSMASNLSAEGEAERVQGGHVSANLFPVLGVDPLLGRGFLPEEGEAGSELVAVISESLWRQRFGADPDLIGSDILVNGQPRTVVGVMPAGFRFPHAEAQLWVPRRFDRSDPVALWGGARGLVVARLAADVTPAQAQAELRALAPEFREANTLWVPPPDWGEDWEVGTSISYVIETEEEPYEDGAAPPMIADRRITPEYVRTMGIPLLEGRALTEADRDGAPRVALINETFAQRFWPGEDPIGKRFKEVWLDDWTTVVGVVGDVKSSGLASETGLEIYRPFSQDPQREMSLVVRTSDDPAPLTANLREVVAAVDAGVPVSRIRTVEQIVSSSVADSRFTMALLAAFATAALLLAAVGVYGVISYAVSRRTRELGLRIAMGAQRAAVLRLVLRHALVMAGVGAVIGLAAALAVTRFLESLLFGVSATDAVTLVIVPLLLVGVALVAAYVPAWRAARVDPVIALRSE